MLNRGIINCEFYPKTGYDRMITLIEFLLLAIS